MIERECDGRRERGGEMIETGYDGERGRGRW